MRVIFTGESISGQKVIPARGFPVLKGTNLALLVQKQLCLDRQIATLDDDFCVVFATYENFTS